MESKKQKWQTSDTQGLRFLVTGAHLLNALFGWLSIVALSLSRLSLFLHFCDSTLSTDLDRHPFLYEPWGSFLSPLRSLALGLSLLPNKNRIQHIITVVMKNDPLTTSEVSNRCTCRVLTEVRVRLLGDMLGTPLGAGVQVFQPFGSTRELSRLTNLSDEAARQK
jgi:hypothetical protein